MEPPEVLRLLESNQPEVVEEAKKKFHEQFNITKEAWLLNALVDYFISTGSMRCVDILVGVREPHDKHFFEKILECLKNISSPRLNALTLLGHVVFRQPTWMYKISQHPLIKELIRILKTETDILILISALLTLIVLLPMIPANVGPYLNDIFEVFSHLAAWNATNPNKLPEPQLIHLQVSLQSLFHRLYGMYPCSFFTYLKNVYSLRENLNVFSHTIRPMLETVKVHPMLIMSSMDSETSTSRWKTMEHHDVVDECAKVSAASRSESITPSFSAFKQRSESELRRCIELAPNLQDPSVQENTVEFWSPSIHCTSSTPPLQTPESSGRTSVLHTPITQTYVKCKFANQEGTSPPEAAIEATPETTPVKDSRHYISPRPPPVNSTVARALNNFTGSRSRSSTSSTPSQSQPSSPMKKEISPFRFPEGHGPPDQNKDLSSEKRKESIFVQRINSIFQDRLNVTSETQLPDKNNVIIRSPAKPSTPDTGDSGKDSNNSFKFDESTQEDQEVLEISRLGQQLRIDSTRPTNYVPTYGECDSVLQDLQPQLADELVCQLDIGSPCNSGGLHMPNSRSMLNFQQSVHRLRYHSQCGSDSHSNQADGFNLSLNDDEQGSVLANQVRRAHSCPEIKKDRPSFCGGENLDESLELDYEKKINGEESKKRAAVSTSTQTHSDDMCSTVYPYEHLFLGIFPPVEQHCCASNCSVGRYSPITTLNTYIETGAGLYGDRYQNQSADENDSTVQNYENELKTVKDQLVLSHLQLKFERQRREVHAERNRRLLGKSRHNRWLEDHNYALRDQLALLEKDIDSISKDFDRSKAESRQNEIKLQEMIKQWQDKCAASENQNRELKSENERLICELAQSKQQATASLKELQQVQAMLFSVGNELKEATVQAGVGEQLKAQIEYLQKELVLMGETQKKYRETIQQFSLRSDENQSISLKYYIEEVKSLNELIDTKTSTLEVMRHRAIEMEALLSKKDNLIAEHKRALKTTKEECQEQLEAVEAKYRTQTTINRKLEECILELTSKVEANNTRRGKRSVSTAQDVLCLAERGGLNSPLSMSLSSSEGMSVSGLITSEAVAPRDLQSIADEQECNQIPELDEQEESSAPP